MLRAVIFDFDGVITDSEILHFRTFNQILGRHGVEITLKDYYKRYLYLTDFDFFKLFVDKGLLELGEGGVETFVEQKKQLFEKLAKTDGRIIEGVRSFLEMLKKNNVTMGICSGALLAEIELILQEARLRSFFDVIVSAEQVKKGKPNPEGLLLTLQKLNHNRQSSILPNQCIVVEDSHWGLEAAKSAGMHTIAVTNSYDAEQLAMAEKVVADLGQLSISDLHELCG